jgi:hypothetical protein
VIDAGATTTVSPGNAALIAPWIVVNCAGSVGSG